MQTQPNIRGQQVALNLPLGWLVGTSFDITLIAGVLVFALAAGMVSVAFPWLFPILLLADLWFLGYHHVVATFTRLAFDAQSFRQYRFLVIGLPVLVAIGVAVSVWIFGSWILATSYLYWQWYHYTRQGYGIARIYQCKSNPTHDRFDEYIMYTVPAAGILYRSYQNPGTFLGLPLKVIPTPLWLVKAAIAISVVAILWWIYRQFKVYREGKLTAAYVLFCLSHFIVFAAAYIFIDNINFGWLVLNIWHNAQYIMFVWMYNNKRFKNEVDEKHWFLSTLSLRENQWKYYTFCLFLSTLVYALSDQALSYVSLPGLASTFPLVLIFYQTLNFHHYIVDAIIWKVRKKPIQQTLEIVV